MYKRRRPSTPYDSQATISYTQSQGSSGSSARRRGARRVLRRYRQPTPYNTPYTFERNVEYNAQLNLNSGWYTKGYGLSFVWSLSQMVITFSDSTNITVSIPGASELTTLFDQWRLDRVDMQAIYSATNHQQTASGTSTQVMPVIRVVSDFDDTDVSSGVNLLEYPQVRTIQLGNMQPKGIRHTIFRPAIQMDAEGLAATVSAVQKRGQWIDCNEPQITHAGIKVGYTSFGDGFPDYSPDLLVGVVKFQFKVYYTLRNPR